MKNTSQEQTDILEILADALSAPHTLNDGLNQIMKLACRLMETEQAAFLQMNEEKQTFEVMAATGLYADSFKIGQTLNLPDRLHGILWRQQNIHKINWIESGIDNLVFPILVMPIYFKGRRIGHLITGASKDANKTNDPMRRKMFSLLAPFASLIIENAKATDLLSQHFATNSRELLESMGIKGKAKLAAESTVTERLMVDSISNPAKVVRLLTESFYRELCNAGFNSAQIAMASAHLLDCIINE